MAAIFIQVKPTEIFHVFSFEYPIKCLLRNATWVLLGQMLGLAKSHQHLQDIREL